MSEATQAPNVTIEKKDNSVIARLTGKMAEEAHLKSMIRLIDEAAGPGSNISLVVVDLSHVTILPSLGLGLLVQVSNKCKTRNQRLKLAGVNPTVRKVFAITRLDRLFDFAASCDAALQ